MVIKLADVSTAAGLKKLNEYLLTRSYISGYQASRGDLAVYSAITSAPDAKYVNVTRCFPGTSAGVKIAGSAASAKCEAEKKASGKKAVVRKSFLLMDVNPWDVETDMVELEKAVRSIQQVLRGEPQNSWMF